MKTLALLMTDVVGSTRAWRDFPAEMDLAMRAHHHILHEAVDAHGGWRPIDQGEGDAVFAAFPSVLQAVEAAASAQRQLAACEWPARTPLTVRMGLHAGDVIDRDGNLFGDTVNRCARVRGLASGGQTLLSAGAHELVRDTLPVGLGLSDLGEHRMKDLVRPERVWQLDIDGLPSEFGPLASLDAVLHNLPIQASTFVGRQQELAEVATLLAAGRLVSLLGPGGTGKTRLAYQVAAEAVEDFPGGIWVTELAPILEERAVALAVLASMGLREEPAVDPTETAVGALRERQALVVLDNCEHLIGTAAELVQTLLSRCPALRVMVTSREALRLPGEAAYQVPGLSFPSAVLTTDLEALAQTDAVRLFVTRASDMRPGFVLTAGNAPDIAAICSHLDGLPLSIELAASRSRSLSPAQINERLGTALELLSKGARGAQARQATLRGTIDWSHRLLSAPEQVLFRRLAVFAGGWQLEAAEQVCSGGDLDRGDVLDTLDSLVDKSLVAVTDDDNGQTRYRLLETIGAYAAERLAEADEADAVADRHGSWCTSLALSASQSAEGSLAEAGWFDRLHADHPNLLAALGHLCRRGEPDALELAAGLRGFWLTRGHERIAHDQFLAALAVGSGPSLTRANVLGALGLVALNRGDYPEAQARFHEALAMSCDLGDRRNEGTWVGKLGIVAFYLGDYPEARTRTEEALAIARDLGDRHDEGRWVGNLGNVAISLGDYPEARGRFEEALAIARELGDRRSEGTWVGNLGNVAISLGDFREARTRLEEALAIARDLGDRHNAGRWVGNLGNVAISQGDYPEARGRFEEALAIARELGDRRSEGTRGGNLGVVACRLGDYPEARARYQEALAIARALGDRLVEGIWVGELGILATRLGDYPQARVRLEEALALAGEVQAQELSLTTLDAVAVLLGRVGRHDEAVELLAWADQTRRQSGAVRERAEQKSADQTFDAAISAIGDEGLERARERGAARSTAETFDLAAARLAGIERRAE